MVVRVTILAVYLLGSQHVGSRAVSVGHLVLALANLNDFGVDFQELEVLPLVQVVLSETLQKLRQKFVRETQNHIIRVNQENGSLSLAKLAL